MISSPTLQPLGYGTAAAESTENPLSIYALILLTYTVASPDPNPRGESQLPNLNECNSTLTSGTTIFTPTSI